MHPILRWILEAISILVVAAILMLIVAVLHNYIFGSAELVAGWNEFLSAIHKPGVIGAAVLVAMVAAARPWWWFW
jgi:ABC-type sulfate transport system permease subunit